MRFRRDKDVSVFPARRVIGQMLFLGGCWVIGVGAIYAAINQPQKPGTRFVAVNHPAHANQLPSLSAESQTPVPKPPELLRLVDTRPTYVRMEVTAYCPCPICCGKGANGYTASGAKVTAAGGHFAAAPDDLPFGTKLIVPGYANGHPIPVLDRGGAIKGTHLDVFFPTHDQAKAWGRKSLAVAVLSK